MTTVKDRLALEVALQVVFAHTDNNIYDKVRSIRYVLHTVVNTLPYTRDDYLTIVIERILDVLEENELSCKV